MKISLFQTEWGSTFLYSSCSAASNSLVKAQELEVLAWAAQGKPIPVPALSHLHHPLSYTCFIYIHVSHIHFLTHTRLSLSHTHTYMSLSHVLTHIQILLLHIHFSPLLFHTHICSGGKYLHLLVFLRLICLLLPFVQDPVMNHTQHFAVVAFCL